MSCRALSIVCSSFTGHDYRSENSVAKLCEGTALSLLGLYSVDDVPIVAYCALITRPRPIMN